MANPGHSAVPADVVGEAARGLPVFDSADIHAMTLALAQAELAAKNGEVPVGAVVLDVAGNVIGAGFNRNISDHDPTAHAEIVALRQAAAHMKNHRLPGARLYVTLEPCVMCLGAMLHARLEKVVYGATDPKTGACGSILALQEQAALNHQTAVQGGLMAFECGEMLRAFFRAKRQARRTL